MAGALGVTTKLLEMPFPLGVAIVGVGATAFVLVVFSDWPWVAGLVAAVFAIATLASLVYPGSDRAAGTATLSVQDIRPRDTRAEWPIMLDRSASDATLARGYLFVLHRDGVVRGFHLANPLVKIRLNVPGAPKDIVFCDGGLLVTYQQRDVAHVRRFTIPDARKEADYAYGYQAGQVLCDSDRAWLNKQNRATAVSVDAETLEKPLLYENPQAGESTFIAVVGGDLWMADASGRRDHDAAVWQIDTSTPNNVATMHSVLPDPQALLFVAGHMYVLHRQPECLMRIDEVARREFGRGVSLGPDARGMIGRGRSLYVFHRAPPQIIKVDGDTAKAVGPPILLDKGVRIADLQVPPNHRKLYALDDSRTPRAIRLTEAMQEAAAGETPGPCTSVTG